ncbi:MAG: ATP-dependent DNA helicase [Acidimicrobiales bacterium]
MTGAGDARLQAALDTALDRVIAGLPGGGEVRDGQRAMVHAVAAAVRDGRHVVVRAGTGTGKSLAYLLPAVLGGRRTVVATASKALQDQLAGKDLPFLRGQLAEPAFSWAVVKGRANYLCRQRADELEAGLGQAELSLGGESMRDELDRLLQWASTSATGDRAELAAEPSPRAWSALSVSGDECPGAARCPRGGDCFAEQARNAAAEADIIVANLALYGVHLGSGERVLPEHDVVIIDECHQLEDVLSSTLGFELGANRFAALAGRVRTIIADQQLPAAIVEAGASLVSLLRGHVGEQLPRPLPVELADAVVLARSRLEAANEALRKIQTSVHDADQRRARAQRVVTAFLQELDIVAELPENYVAWVPDGGDPRLAVAPIEVGPVLGATVWGNRTAVLTSATIPSGMARRVGLRTGQYDELDVGSPFDYEHHGLLYCALHLPDPRAAGYCDALHDELAALIGAAGGRTLALFTSWRALEAAVAALRPRLEVPVLAQGDLPVPRLVEQFRSDPATCLFATTGLFQGIDVPGETLSLVTIDRLPFPRPDDPLLNARRDRAGASAFATIDVPRAATLLAQAAGRLIRSSEDRGVVAVFDRRLGTARYRWEIIRSLPPFARTRHRAEVESFLRTVTGG